MGWETLYSILYNVLNSKLNQLHIQFNKQHFLEFAPAKRTNLPQRIRRIKRRAFYGALKLLS